MKNCEKAQTPGVNLVRIFCKETHEMKKINLPPVFVTECDGVYSTHMPVILLDDFV